MKLLNDSSIEYHTYQAKEDKPYRVVLKNLHHSIPTDYISQELTELGFSGRNVINIKKRQSNDPLPLFFIDLNPEINNPDIFKLESLCYAKIKIEELHTRRDLPNVIDAKTLVIVVHIVTVNQDAFAVDKTTSLTRVKKAKTYQLLVLYAVKVTHQTIKDARSINNLQSPLTPTLSKLFNLSAYD